MQPVFTIFCGSQAVYEKLNFDELVSTCILLLNAGHEATVHTIGNGINALLSNKIDCDFFNEKDWHNVVEEILRYDPPLHIFTRFAYEDLTIDDIAISHGEKISLVIGASGQDTRRWDNPSEFLPNRRPVTNNSFGAGTPHYWHQSNWFATEHSTAGLSRLPLRRDTLWEIAGRHIWWHGDHSEVKRRY